MNKTIFILIAAGLIAIGPAGAGDDIAPEKSFSRSEIDSMMNLPESNQRQEATGAILNAVDFDTTWAFETIIMGLEIEQDYLKRSKEINSRYVWNSWWNIKKYIRDLALLGSYSVASLGDYGENLSPDQKTWVLIAEGYQKNEALHDKLREIAAVKGKPLQKAMAVEALSQYKDTSDISIFVDAAMDNENSIDWAGESDLPGFNPVAERGVIALREMGYILEWDSQEFKSNLKKIEDVEIKNPKPKPGDQNE
jgi:hypothetical protein